MKHNRSDIAVIGKKTWFIQVAISRNRLNTHTHTKAQQNVRICKLSCKGACFWKKKSSIVLIVIGALWVILKSSTIYQSWHHWLETKNLACNFLYIPMSSSWFLGCLLEPESSENTQSKTCGVHWVTENCNRAAAVVIKSFWKCYLCIMLLKPLQQQSSKEGKHYSCHILQKGEIKMRMACQKNIM